MSKFASMIQGISYLMDGLVFTFEAIGIWGVCFLGLDKKIETKERDFSISHSDFEAFRRDREALASDWQKIGNDMRKAMDEYVKTH